MKKLLSCLLCLNLCLNNMIQKISPTNLMELCSRFFLAHVFFLSGRTKVEPGTILSVSDNTIFLFEHEYNLPIISPILAAYLATYAENILSILIFIGLFTRLSAFALLCMTFIIQVFVYPEAYATHLSWTIACLILMHFGGGFLSLDRFIPKNFR